MTTGDTLISTSSVQPGVLPFDQYGRYQMMRDALDAARPLIGVRLRVLDVGGFFRGMDGVALTPASLFLPDDEVTVLDQVPLQPGDDLPGYIQGDGRSLDFPDGAFDFVISCDTLEHVPASNRPDFWRELLRVARCGVLLAAPFSSPEVVAAEDLLFHYIQAELGVEQPQLREHRDYGLPTLEDTCTLLDTLDRDYRVYPSGNVHSWLFMMLARHYLSVQIDQQELLQRLDDYYIRFFSHHERCEPAYRHMFTVARPGQGDWLASTDAALSPTIQTEVGDRTLVEPDLATWLFQLLTLQLANQHNHTIHTILVNLSNQVTAEFQVARELRQELAQRNQHVADLEQRANWLQGQSEAAQRELSAIKQGRIMRLLSWLRRLSKR